MLYAVNMPPPFPPYVMQCVAYASRESNLPPLALLSILKAEGGRPGLVSRNKNGTNDYGRGQINDVWVRRLTKSGYALSPSRLVYDDCYNIRLTAWIANYEIRDAGGDFWRGIGNYHSHAAPYHQRYQKIIYHHMQYLSRHTNWDVK